MLGHWNFKLKLIFNQHWYQDLKFMAVCPQTATGLVHVYNNCNTLQDKRESWGMEQQQKKHMQMQNKLSSR